ncbi:MAG: hypothetical protein AAF648_16940 [Pseudomonadota bacterium]
MASLIDKRGQLRYGDLEQQRRARANRQAMNERQRQAQLRTEVAHLSSQVRDLLELVDAMISIHGAEVLGDAVLRRRAELASGDQASGKGAAYDHSR